MYPPFNTSSGTARPSKDDWRSKHAPLTLESLELQYRLESADGLEQQLEVLHDATMYMEENILDWEQKYQLFQSLKEILEDRATWESEDVQKRIKKMEKHQSLEIQERLESAVGLEHQMEVLHDATIFMEENILDWEWKYQLFQSLKEILEDSETWESDDVQQWIMEWNALARGTSNLDKKKSVSYKC